MLRRRAQRGGQMGAASQAAATGPVSQAAEERIGTRFTMKQRLFAFGDDFWIKNERGEKAFKVDGKMLRLRDTLRFEDARGRELYHITARLVDVRETMDIERAGGGKAAIVHNAWISPLRDRWRIDVPGGQNLVAQGNILQHEYRIEQGRQRIAEISKRWLRLRDTYGVEVQDAADAALMLAITVAIDMMSHNATPHKDHGISRGSGLDLF